MGRSHQTFGKKEREKKKAKKKKEKEEKRLAKKDEGTSSFDDMIAYVDAEGNIVDTPPEPVDKENEIKAEDIVVGVPPKDWVEEDPVKTGIVSFFNHDKGYGFIKDAETKDSIFVHVNNIDEDEINEGNKVSYETQAGMKGPEACKVKLIRD